MGWTHLPVSPGEVVGAEQIAELRAAIIERRRAVGYGPGGGLGDPPEVPAGELALACRIDEYRDRIEEVLERYCNTGNPASWWTKEAALQAALGEGVTEWTNVPSRAGQKQSGPTLPEGTVMYAEHLNEMKAVLDELYIVPLAEQDGRRYCRNNGSGWEWSDTDYATGKTIVTSVNHQSGAASEKGESGPFDFRFEPVEAVSVVQVSAKGRLQGIEEDLLAKFVNFINGGGSQPSDRDWHAQLRVSQECPTGSPRDGEIACLEFENNLADDGSHTSDGKNDADNTLEVYIDDWWGPELISNAPEPSDWPFWLTFIMDDYAAVKSAYVSEAEGSGRELYQLLGTAWFWISHIWAELDFDYLS